MILSMDYARFEYSYVTLDLEAGSTPQVTEKIIRIQKCCAHRWAQRVQNEFRIKTTIRDSHALAGGTP